MTWGMVAVAGATVVTGAMSANAAGNAADAQAASAQAGMDEQRRQFDAIQKLLQPYVAAGTGALGQQQALIGASGPQTQQQAIDALRNSPQFTSLLKQGENSILANASATGGLRGGNTQAALAQFSPALLSQLINDQYTRLGGLTALGQNAAAGVGNAGMNTGTAISNLLQQQGAAQAGGALAQGQIFGNTIGGLAQIGGAYMANRGGFGGQTYTGDTALSNAQLAQKYGF